MTAFDLIGFRSQLKGDGARPNLFEVQLNLPQSGIATVDNPLDTTKAISFLCRATQLPGSTMGIASVPFMGREFKLPGDPTFPEWTITLINDEDFTIRNSFEKWINALRGHRSNLRDPNALSAEQYSVDAYVFQYGKRGPNFGDTKSTLRAGGAIKAYKMIGAWPSVVSPIELAYDTNNTVEEYSVTFAYQWWESFGDDITT